MPSPTRSRIIYALLAISVLAGIPLAGLVGYEVGGRQAFAQGSLRSSYAGDSVDALIAIRAIKYLDAGELDKARELLDSIADGAMLSYSAYSDLDFSRFQTSSDTRDIPASYRRVAEYRIKHPTSMPNEKTRNTINETAEGLLRDVPGRSELKTAKSLAAE